MLGKYFMMYDKKVKKLAGSSRRELELLCFILLYLACLGDIMLACGAVH